MDRGLAVLCFLMGIAMMVVAFPEGFTAAAVVLLSSLVVVFIIRRQFKEDADFLIQLFLVALLARLTFGLVVHFFDLRDFFGGDSATYDLVGQRLVETWYGYNFVTNDDISRKISNSDSGWGMYYLVGAIYSIVGKNIFAAQSFCAVIGAATVPMVYTCAHKIFNNMRSALI